MRAVAALALQLRAFAVVGEEGGNAQLGCCCEDDAGCNSPLRCAADDVYCCMERRRHDGVCNENGSVPECWCGADSRGHLSNLECLSAASGGDASCSCDNCDDFVPIVLEIACAQAASCEEGGACEPGWDDDDCDRGCDGPDCDNQDGCAAMMGMFVVQAILVVVGVGLVSGCIFEHIHSGKTLELHRTHGQTVGGRCVAQWSKGDDPPISYCRMVYCVRMPNPTATAAFWMVTKEVRSWAKEGDVVQMNHIMSVTGNPCSAVLESHQMHPLGNCVCLQCCGAACIFLFGTVFTGAPMAMAFLECGALALFWYLPIFICVPLLCNYWNAKHQEKMRTEGDVVEVDEQAAANLLTVPIEGLGSMLTSGEQQQAYVKQQVLPMATVTTVATPVAVPLATGVTSAARINPTPTPVATTITSNPVVGAQPTAFYDV